MEGNNIISNLNMRIGVFPDTKGRRDTYCWR